MSSVNLKNLSQDELNKILKEEYEKNKKLKKERSIQIIKKLQKQNEKLAQVKSTSFKDYSIMSFTEITRNGETFIMKDEGLKGFVIEYKDLLHY